MSFCRGTPTKKPNLAVLDRAGRKRCTGHRSVHLQVNSDPHKLKCAVIILLPAITRATKWANHARHYGEAPTKELKSGYLTGVVNKAYLRHRLVLRRVRSNPHNLKKCAVVARLSSRRRTVEHADRLRGWGEIPMREPKSADFHR